mmetsp:Transcript_77959/g.218059  ORF Transcript_77959/g.218059 Transcript_77959/m.218059 type:complete len:209 (+) Transcript_77959:34-660(+)
MRHDNLEPPGTPSSTDPRLLPGPLLDLRSAAGAGDDEAAHLRSLLGRARPGHELVVDGRALCAEQFEVLRLVVLGLLPHELHHHPVVRRRRRRLLCRRVHRSGVLGAFKVLHNLLGERSVLPVYLALQCLHLHQPPVDHPPQPGVHLGRAVEVGTRLLLSAQVVVAYSTAKQSFDIELVDVHEDLGQLSLCILPPIVFHEDERPVEKQ